MHVVVVRILQLRVSELHGREIVIQFVQIHTESAHKAIPTEQLFSDELEGVAARLLLQFEDVKVPVVNFLWNNFVIRFTSSLSSAVVTDKSEHSKLNLALVDSVL